MHWLTPGRRANPRMIWQELCTGMWAKKKPGLALHTVWITAQDVTSRSPASSEEGKPSLEPEFPKRQKLSWLCSILLASSTNTQISRGQTSGFQHITIKQLAHYQNLPCTLGNKPQTQTETTKDFLYRHHQIQKRDITLLGVV